MADYDSFLDTKRWESPDCGILDPPALSPKLFEFQADIVRWALRKGRAAIFADCGLGKTVQELEWARVVSAHVEAPVLILAPLAVSHQTVEEGRKFDICVNLCREQTDVRNGINITNYEKLDNFKPEEFGGVVIDESSIIKAFDGATRNAVINSFAQTPFRLAATATPAPNDYIELGNHSEFLGIMKRPEMLASFFVHDGGDTQSWRLRGHAEDAFWSWVCSWAIMMRKPSDLGYSDEGFVLPVCNIIEHPIKSERPQEGMLFAVPARGLDEQRKARRGTLEQRVKTVADLVNASGESWLVWCELNDEGNMLASLIPGAVQVSGSDAPEVKEERLSGFAHSKFRVLITKPKVGGFGLNLQAHHNMAFVGLSNSYEQTYQAIRREWRFGQEHDVNVHIVSTDIESEVMANIKRKEEEAQRMAREMVTHMRDLNMASLRGSVRDQVEYSNKLAISIPDWLQNND